MTHKITGCTDCPFSHEYTMAIGFGCKIDDVAARKKDPSKYGRSIKQSKRFQPVTPEWCPVKAEPVMVQY